MGKATVDYVVIGGVDYEAVAQGQTNQILGTAGASGDLLSRLAVDVATSLTSGVSIKDGANTAIEVVPANTPIGPYRVEVGIRSTNGAWQVTTGAGVSCIAVGQFSV